MIEADEYDSAFFDKRSKFVHYHPRTLVLNNLEFDHADIFDDLGAIQRQFHHLIRTVPGQGQILCADADSALQEVLEMGCWTQVEKVDGDSARWQLTLDRPDGREFSVWLDGEKLGTVSWGILGRHNAHNALMAIAAARHVGVLPQHAIEALCEFQAPKRRLELRGEHNNILVFDDFAHHPTAIAATLDALKSPEGRTIAVLEPRSNTMRQGSHRDTLAGSLAQADEVYLFQPDGMSWDLQQEVANHLSCARVFNDHQQLLQAVLENARPGDRIVVMSNGGFANMPERIVLGLAG